MDFVEGPPVCKRCLSVLKMEPDDFQTETLPDIFILKGLFVCRLCKGVNRIQLSVVEYG